MESNVGSVDRLVRVGSQAGLCPPNVRLLVEDLACDEPGISRFSARLWKRLPEFRGVR